MGSRTLFISVIILAVLFLILIIGDYVTQSWNWVGVSGFTAPTAEYQRGKTLWDWLSLLVVPVVLLLGLWWFNKQQRSAEREIAKEQAEEHRKMEKDGEEQRVLQSYFEAVTTLLLDKDLRSSEEAQNIARSRTLIILDDLSSKHKGSIARFLF